MKRIIKALTLSILLFAATSCLTLNLNDDNKSKGNSAAAHAEAPGQNK